MNGKVIARLTVTRTNGRKTIVEIHVDARFHNFYRFYQQVGNKRSTKRLTRSASRNEGLNIINAHLQKPGLDVIEQRLRSFQSQTNPVIRVTLRIIKKQAYRKLINARPDELGLTKLTATDLNSSRRPIPVTLSFRLVEKISRRKLHRGIVR